MTEYFQQLLKNQVSVSNHLIVVLKLIMSKNINSKEYLTKGMLNEAVDAIIEGVGNLVHDEVNILRNETKNGFKSMENTIDLRFNNLEAKVDSNYLELKDDINGLKADLATHHHSTI